MLTRIIIGAVLTIPLLFRMFHMPVLLPKYFELALGTLVQFGIGYSFYIGTFNALRKGRANMDVLVALGTSSAYGLSVWSTFTGHDAIYYEVSGVLIVLILLGRMLEHRSKDAARSGMQALFTLQVQSAKVMLDEGWATVDIEKVKIGDRVLIRAGESVPVDGTISQGETYLNEAMLTGESTKTRKVIGDRVFSGTLNGNGVIEIVAEAIGSETALGRIIHLVEKAAASRPPVQKIVNQVTRIFVPSVLCVSIITFVLWWWLGGEIERAILHAVAVLVISCPCALGLATPMVILVATTLGAKEGILVKNAESLQKGAKIDTILLDKTGTITEGNLTVDEVKGDIHLAAALAAYSDHPLSAAIVEYAKEGNGDTPIDFKAVPGKGIMGTLSGVRVFLGSQQFLQEHGIDVICPKDNRTLVVFGSKNSHGYVLLTDHIKNGSRESIAALHKMGLEVGVVSGDRKEVVENVADKVGATFWFAGTLPEEKADCVKRLQLQGKTVGMVGDGINDAPALMQADVGFAIGMGTDVAMENADVGLMHSDLVNLVRSINLARRTMKKMKGNLIFAFLFNGIGIPIAAAGYLNPMIAGIAMGLSSISVVLNAISLRNR
jgi:P-type Cu+ transporter